MFKYIFSKNFSLSSSLFSINNLSNKKYTYYDEIIKILFFVPISAIFYALFSGFLNNLIKNFGISIEQGSLESIVEYYIILAISYIVVYLSTFRRSKKDIEQYPLEPYNGKQKNVPLLVLLGFCFAMFGNVLSGAFNALVEGIISVNDFKDSSIVNLLIGSNETYEKINKNDINSMVIFFFILVIVVPVMEELIFRELFYSRMVRFSVCSSIFFVSIMFALNHGCISQILFAFFAGMGFAIVRRYTNSVVNSMICHALVNFFAFFSQFILTKYPEYFLAFAIVSSVVGFILLLTNKDLFSFTNFKEVDGEKHEKSNIQ